MLSGARLVLKKAGNGFGAVPQEAVQVLREATREWTVESLSAMIASGECPREYIDFTAKYVMQHPGLAFSMQDKAAFVAACWRARPELAALLVTPEGDRWLDAVSFELYRTLMGELPKLFGIGRA